MTARALLRELSNRGRLPDFHFEVQPDQPAPNSSIRALARENPATILVLAGAAHSVTLLEQVRAACPGAALLGGPSLCKSAFLTRSGDLTNHVRYPILLEKSDSPESFRFAHAFQSARGRAPDYTAVFSYDATRLLIAAIRRSGPSRAAVRAALHALSPWPGLGGIIHFDGSGQNIRSNIFIRPASPFGRAP